MIEKRSQALDSRVSGIKEPDRGLVKQAALSEETSDYIHSEKADPTDGVILVVNALGAGEYYGPNINGDHFPEEALLGRQDEMEAMKNPPESRGERLIRFKTFENGHVFEHHKNDDPEKACGDILKASWNPKMHRVELVTKVTGDTADKVMRKIRNDKPVPVSMGTRVPYDICNQCGNRAPNRKKYCEHLKNKMGDVTDEGRKICAINTKPRFFDLSIVTVPADRTAYALKVISDSKASEENSSEAKPKAPAESDGQTKEASVKESDEKESDIDKQVHEYMDTETLDSLSDHHPTEVISTMFASGVEPKEAEAQWLWIQHFDKEAGQKACNRMIKYNVDDTLFKEASISNEKFLDKPPKDEIVKKASDYIKSNSCFTDDPKEAQASISPRPAPLPDTAGIQSQGERAAINTGAAITTGAAAGSLAKRAMEALQIGDKETIRTLLKSYPGLMMTLMSVLGVGASRLTQGGGGTPKANLGRR